MERWSSRTGFLLAAIGAAVGLGNIWRFSAVVGQNGGGAYLVPYLLAAFVFALPLLVLEISVGRALRTDVVGAFRSVRPEFEPLGWVVSGSVLLILSYYLVLTGWVLSFLVAAVAGVDLEFAAFTETYWPLAGFVVATLLTGGIVSAGVRDGIERMSKAVMPAVFLVLVGLAVFAATTEGFDEAVSFLLTPDPSVLSDPLVWSAAFGQVFFSLSVGQGIMLTYGSYLGEDADVVRSSLLITIADVAVALLAGFVIFPIVFSVEGLAPTLGTELAFSTLPVAFASMPYGRVVAIAFFGLLFVAALSSAVSLLEVGVAPLVRTSNRSRRRVSVLLAAGVFLAGLPAALSYSALKLAIGAVPVLDWMDETVGTLALPVTAILIAIAFTWFGDRDAVLERLYVSAFVPILKYVTPVILFVVTALKLGARFDVPAWQRLPGVAAIGLAPRIALTALALVALYLVGRGLVRYRRRPGKRG